MLWRSFLGISIFAVAACVSSTRGVKSSAPTPSPRSSTFPPGWTLTPDTVTATYSSTLVTTLELQSDSLPARDTVAVTADFSLRINPESSPGRFDGFVDSVSFTAGTRIGQPEGFTMLPLRFSGSLERTAAIVDSADGRPISMTTACADNRLSAFPVIQRSVLVLPTRISSGMTWTDSTVVPGCSGPIPVSITSKRSYQVNGETSYEGKRAILLERTERTIVTGEGAQGQHRVFLRSEGSGTARMYADPSSGRLMGVDGTHEAIILVTSSGRTQRFRQAIRERTSLISEK